MFGLRAALGLRGPFDLFGRFDLSCKSIAISLLLEAWARSEGTRVRASKDPILKPQLNKGDNMAKLSPAIASLLRVQVNRNGLRVALKSSFLLVLLSLCPAVSHAKVSVWLQSPKPGENTNQVKVYATARSTHGVKRWTIFVDDAIAYQVTNNSDTLSHTMTLTNGRHILYTRAWDDTSSGISAVLLLQIGAPAWTNGVLPTPPTTAHVITGMQNTTTDWKDCSICAAGTNETTNYSMVPFRSDPSMTGSSRELFVGGLPWTNALFIKSMFGTSTVSHYIWDFWVYHDATSAANIWSAEFDLFHFLGGTEFMIGSQCDFGDGYWNTWDSANNRWIMDGVRCPRWAADTWHHIQWYVERISPTQYRYDTLVVDGHGYGLNQVWKVNPTTWRDAVGIQYQLDQSGSGTPIHQWVDKVKLTTW